MTPLNALNLIGLSLIVAALAGCGDSKISAVKDTRMRGDEFTVGETLGKIKECKSADWSSEIVNNTTIVTHTCTVELSDDIRDKAKAGELAALKTHAGLANMSITGDLFRLRNEKKEVERRSEEQVAQMTQSAQNPALYNDEQKEELLVRIEADRKKAAERAQNLQNRIDELTPWDEKYEQAIAQTYAAVVKDVDVFYNKNHDIKVKTSFRYREGGNAELLNSSFIVDGVESKGAIPVYLMDPKRMGEYLIYVTKSGFGMKVDDLFDERFPIEFVPGPDANIYRYKGAKPAA